ncbi:MAG: hypothetical protein BMS9Abin28_0064 [Anaerolineae bacterium]|nr:MAG: hypothetical protein BMS9Abin28_0064 [Anaerolineae bacterium]
MAAERMSGTVKWFSRVKGYGFIAPDDDESEIFVHFTGIEGEGYRNLEKGEKVSFVVEDTEKGPQAVQVRAEGFDVTSWTAEPTDEPAEGVVGETSWRVEDEAEASGSEEETSDEPEQEEDEASGSEEETSDEPEQEEDEASGSEEETSDEPEQEEDEASGSEEETSDDLGHEEAGDETPDLVA